MKNPLILAAIASLALTAFGSASAQQATYELPQPVVVGNTRAAVVAELQQARAAGSLSVTELDRQTRAPFVASRSRDEVRAETLAAAGNGELQALNSEAGAAGISGTGRHATVHRMHAAMR